MEITYHMAWERDRISYGDNCDATKVSYGTLLGSDSLTCQYGCSGSISSLQYMCTEFSINDDWSFGSRVISYDFSTTASGNIITIGFTGNAWLGFAKWNVSTTFNLRPRYDTGQVNSSPRAITLPIHRVQEGCYHTIPLAVSDPDGDVIRCRWAVGKECESVCSAIPGAVLNSNTCTITYQANSGTGYKAVAVMVEDFIPESSQPLSSVAFQFLVLVVSSNQSCYKPFFASPTPSSGSRITIPPGGTFTTQLEADSGSGIRFSTTEMQIAGPVGLRKGGLRNVHDDNYDVSITWTPQVDQIDIAHHFCFAAINSEGIGSEQSCILLVPQCYTLHPIPFASKLSVYLHNVSLYIEFNATVLPSLMSAQVTFVELNSDRAVYTIGFSTSEVTFNNSTHMTIRPKYMFTDGSTYYIQFPFSCNHIKLTDKTLWTFEVTGKLFAHIC